MIGPIAIIAALCGLVLASGLAVEGPYSSIGPIIVLDPIKKPQVSLSEPLVPKEDYTLYWGQPGKSTDHPSFAHLELPFDDDPY